MCGLVALISPAIPIDRSLLDTMRDRLFHRGPDRGLTWIHDLERVGFAHRRLSILDLSSNADQPMVSKDGNFRIVYNGEIYNYVEIRSELSAKGINFRTNSDTEVLLEALIEWGESAISKLNGMFAFALWDEKRKQILIARDRFGEKPLFVGRGRFGTTVIASEMKSILTHPLIPCFTDQEALTRYGNGSWYEDDSQTFFEGIERLPAAHAAWIDLNGDIARKWRYWIPSYTEIDYEISADTAIERFSELLQESIRMRLRSDVAVGSSLSGGLDSSTIVGFLSNEREKSQFSQNTFSAIFPNDPTISEHNEIKLVAEHTGVDSFTVAPEPNLFKEECRRLHYHQEEPFASASIYLQWCVARLAREHNTTVLLDGQGADELLAGYQHYFRQYQLDLLDHGKLEEAIRITEIFRSRLIEVASQYDDAGRRVNLDLSFTEDWLRTMNNNLPDVFHYDYSVGVAPPQKGFRLRRTISEALLYNSLPMLLRYADRNSMAFSREARLPYLDHKLVDFCLTLPDSLYINNGWQKFILREASEEIIPEAIRWRADKVGYAAPLDIWIRSDLKEWVQERIYDESIRDVPSYDLKTIQTLWDDHQSNKGNNSWALWKWASLAEWFDLKDLGTWRMGMPTHLN